MKVLVCGGRGYFDGARLNLELDRLHALRPITTIIHGAAKGADLMAALWASSMRIPDWRFPADWDKHGKAAGMIRNRLMLTMGEPDMVLAFPGGVGTAGMVSIARNAGIYVECVS